MPRIIDYQEVTEAGANDVVMLDGPNGSKKITCKNLLKPVEDKIPDIEEYTVLASVNGNGSKTTGQVFKELLDATNITDLLAKQKTLRLIETLTTEGETEKHIYRLDHIRDNGNIAFSYTRMINASAFFQMYGYAKEGTSYYATYYNVIQQRISDITSNPLSSSVKLELVY